MAGPRRLLILRRGEFAPPAPGLGTLMEDVTATMEDAVVKMEES